MKKFIYVLMAVCAIASCKAKGDKAQTEEEADVPAALPEAIDTAAAAKAAQALPEEPVFDIVTNYGTIKVKLYKDTPIHRNNFEKLAMAGYYDSLLFHRVVPGFVIQGGDPLTRDTSKVEQYGSGGPDYTLKAELRDEEGNPLHRHIRGALAAARRGDIANPFKESSASQFYLVLDEKACEHLNGEYTVFGETVAGFNVMDKISRVERDRKDLPTREVRIISIKPDEELNLLQNQGTDIAVKTDE